MNPPAGIKLTTVLMVIAVLLHLVAASASPFPMLWSESHGLARFIASVVGGALAGVLIAIFEGLVLYLYWNGRRWSRWAVVLGCLLCFVSLRHFIVGPTVSHGRALIIFYRIAVAIGVMGYLCTDQARAWFNQRFTDEWDQ